MQFNNRTNQLLLVLILIIAGILRFYNFFSLPFMWDELSAWSRLQFNSFSDLINKGVKPDGHPAGVQVFLYYWTSFFGDKEWVVKLPFNLMGLSSVWLIYAITKIWFDKKSGLIAATFAASLQFFVLYSSIARPYSSGLFFSLFMVYYWSQYMFRFPSRKYLLGFVIFAVLSAYNHHFSLLFAAIVGFSGLFTISKSQYKEYILSGIIIFVLYIPHLDIFFHQLGIGGIGGEGNWLAKPKISFAFDFIYWSFHFSIINILIVSIFLIASIIALFFDGNKRSFTKFSLLIIWFASPLIIGLYYSIQINPVIQYSVLIFSFPYLIILISSFAKKIPNILTYLIIVGILVLNIYQLVFERKHFEITQKQPFDLTAKLINNNKSSVFAIVNTIPEYQKYYLDKYSLSDIEFYSIYNQELTDLEFDSIVSNIKEDRVVCCGLPPHYEQIIFRHYPYLVDRENAYTMNCFVFSKFEKDKHTAFSKEVEFINFNEEHNGWKISDKRIVTDSTGNSFFEFKTDQEWGFTFEDSLLRYPLNTLFDFKVKIIANSANERPSWVFSNRLGKEVKFWRGKPVQLIPLEEHNEYISFFSVDSRLIPKELPKDSLDLKFYIWNKNHDQFKIDKISMSVRESNPIKYGLFDKIQ